jgi:hypothetical protein
MPIQSLIIPEVLDAGEAIFRKVEMNRLGCKNVVFTRYNITNSYKLFITARSALISV